MFGIVFGTLCLVGLIVVLARGRRGFGHPRWGHHHHRYGYFGPRAFVNGVLARLDTAPGQEKVIVAAVEEFVDRARESARTVRESRRDLAASVRGEQLDEARLADVFGRHDAALADVRRAAVDALHKIHAALDDRQRKLFADLVESGGYFSFHRHAYGC